MGKNIKVVGGLSRRAKINIFIGIFLIFIILTVLLSINQIVNVIEKREKIVELEEKLNWIRNSNIELLAREKSLYRDDTVELEARKQFNMASSDENEKNFSVVITNEEDIGEKEIGTKTELNDDIYSNTNLWENIKIFYNKEIRE